MQVHTGQRETIRCTLNQDDFNRFAVLSGDDNPIHVDPEFSARTRFGKPVAHGMLLYSTIAGALSQYFPGWAQVEQELMFPHPTYVDEAYDIELEVTEMLPDGTAWVRTDVVKADGSLGCQGRALLRPPAAERGLP
jgi:3-hydroxybutyryl-CoA dehydratase